LKDTLCDLNAHHRMRHLGPSGCLQRSSLAPQALRCRRHRRLRFTPTPPYDSTHASARWEASIPFTIRRRHADRLARWRRPLSVREARLKEVAGVRAGLRPRGHEADARLADHGGGARGGNDPERGRHGARRGPGLVSTGRASAGAAGADRRALPGCVRCGRPGRAADQAGSAQAPSAPGGMEVPAERVR